MSKDVDDVSCKMNSPSKSTPNKGSSKTKGSAKSSRKVQNVWISWQRFQSTLRIVLESEWEQKKSDAVSYLRQVQEIFEHLSWKLMLLALTPMLSYLSIFKTYPFWKQVLHLPTKPHLFLPVIEHWLFQCLPHQILSRMSNPLFDLLAAVPYLLHFSVPVLFIMYWLTCRRSRGVNNIYVYLWCAGWVNMIAVIIQFLMPTAPPWFNDSAVFDMDGQLISAAPNEAAFQRIDAAIGRPMFHEIYGQSPLKYGSFPSLHVAWPTVVLLHQPWISNKVGLLHVIWISWAALYSSHHYLVDALGGIMLVMTVKFCMNYIWHPFQTQAVVSKPRINYQRLNSCSRTV